MVVTMAAMIAIVAASLIHVAHRREKSRCQSDQQGARQNFGPGDSWPAILEVTDNAWESWQSVDGCAAHWLDGWSKSPRANPVGVHFPEPGGASERRLVIELSA